MKVTANARMMMLEPETMQEALLLWEQAKLYEHLGVVQTCLQAPKADDQRRILLGIDMASTHSSAWRKEDRESFRRKKP